MSHFSYIRERVVEGIVEEFALYRGVLVAIRHQAKQSNIAISQT